MMMMIFFFRFHIKVVSAVEERINSILNLTKSINETSVWCDIDANLNKIQ